jgi:hypothetical protein
MTSDYKFRFARGGVAGRNGYQFGGEPTMEDAMREAEEQGLGATPQPPDRPQYPRLIQKESGNNFAARNKQGYVGRAQFGEARLADAKKAGVIPAEATTENFRMNPDMQKAAESWHFGDINNFIDRTGLASMEGKVINGVPVTREGMVNVAHLGGKGGLQKFITSGGQYNPADANGTRLSDYFAMGSGGGGGGENIQPMSADASGLGGASQPLEGEVIPPSEKPKSGFSLKNLFASETNPSIVEQIIGRRLSPEARSAMLNASFALMAGRSPNFLTNVGEAGRVGTQTYYNALAQRQETEKQRADAEREQFEAQTQRLTAETAQEKAAREQQEAATRQQQLEMAIAQLPPDQQAAARLAPDAFFKAQAESIFGTADLPALVEEYRAAKEEGYEGTLEDWKKISAAGDNDLGLQLVPLTDREGNFVGYGQASKAGGIYFQGELIDGANVRPMDPSLMAQTRAAGSAMGTQMGGAAAEVVGAQIEADAMNATIDLLIENPNLEDAIGYGNVLTDYLVSNEVLKIRSDLNKLEGGAFLSAYSTLKGGGQITEMESEQAKKAIADIQTARRMSDRKMFVDALESLRDAFNRGVAKLRAKAGQYAPQGGTPPVTSGVPPEGEMPDVSQMTEEQLKAIVGGQNGQ